MKLFYYIKNFGRNALPAFYFRHQYKRIKANESRCNPEELKTRLDYYFKVSEPFNLPTNAVAVEDFKRTKGTGYYFDLKEFLHYFKKETRFAYKFGDDTTVFDYPCLFKARPVGNQNANSILFKLNKKRHFKWVNDQIPFREKEDRMVWRGAAYLELRRTLIEQIWDHPMVEAGQTNKPAEDVPWQKEPMSIEEQLKFKFIFCPEGNDVATNLKWAMSSNSVCVMPKPTCETWFMEGILEDGIHYLEIKNDASDLEEKLNHYLAHPDKCEAIIANAHKHVARFQNEDLEEVLCLKVLERYTELSGQTNALKF